MKKVEKIRIPKRLFTKEFKVEAVKLVTEQGLTQSEAAKQLGLSPKTYSLWVRQAQAGTIRGTHQSAEQLRIRELERELMIARMERDILKKATAFFAKESR